MGLHTEQLDELRVLVLVEDSASFDSNLLAQHGISLFVEARWGGHLKRIIVDVGPDPSTLQHNMETLNIDPCSIDIVVLTHCHYDHTSGVSSLVARTGRKDLLVIGHPELFRPNFTTSPCLKYVGMRTSDAPDRISAAGARLLLSKDPLQIAPGLCTTGQVPRVTPFEDTGMSFFTLVDGKVTQDSMLDDMALVANVKGRGVVIVTGCSHSGIVNIVKQAMQIYPDSKLDGIIGGFHLIKASHERVRLTVESIAALEPRWVSAGHCTGFQAQVALHLALGERFTPLHCGSQFIVSGDL